MQKTIYISPKDEDLFKEAQGLLGQSSISSTIIEALKYVIAHKNNEITVYELKNGPLPVKLYGKELAIFRTEEERKKLPLFRAFKTKSGKIIVSMETENDQVLFRYEDLKDFEKRGKEDLPNVRGIFMRILVEMKKDRLVEIID